MIFYIICLVINLLGMGYLFYINEKQQHINREFLTNALLVNASLEYIKNELEKLKDRILELEQKLEQTKK
jgi:5-bromo-4-chloroindolyl phosphate hydrolysis protein